MKKEWHCHTCKSVFQKQPIGCLRLYRSIQLERKIRERRSKVEERLSLTETKAEDGGLILGSGLEWSRQYNRPTIASNHSKHN
jgi:hypothetical protein